MSSRRISVVAVLVCLLALSLSGQPAPDLSGHWEGEVHAPGMEVVIEVDLVRGAKGDLTGTFGNAAQNVHGFPLSNVAAEGMVVTFEIKANGGGKFHGDLSADGKSIKGSFHTQGMDLPFDLTRSGAAKVEAVAKSAPISKELEGSWRGTIDVNGKPVTVALRLVNHPDATSSGTLISQEGVEIPISRLEETGSNVKLEIRSVGSSYTGTIKGDGSELTGTFTQGAFSGALVFHRPEADTAKGAASSAASPAGSPARTAASSLETLVARWADAVGGRAKVAAVNATYREGTLEVGGMKGTLKAWHTADGRYRKEEQVGPFSSVEIFDGTKGTLQQGDTPPHVMAGPELARARSTPYANWNAVFFAFFPERRHGALTLDGDALVLQPEGGIDWRVALDPETGLPKTMVHKQGDRTITVTFGAYEVVDGLRFEKELQRSAGDPRSGATIRFTKTVVNPPIEPSLFTIEAKKTAAAAQ